MTMEQSLLYMILLVITTCNSKLLPNCEKVLPTLPELESSIVTQLSGPSPVIEDGIQYTCVARGNTQGMYRAASGIVAYHNHHKGHHGEHHKLGHFHVHCYNGEWLIDDSEPAHTKHEHCRQCNELYNITNCNECSSKCNNGDICCSYYRNGSCNIQCLKSSSINQYNKSTVLVTPTPTSVEYCSQCKYKKSTCSQNCSTHTVNSYSSVNTTVTNAHPHPHHPPSCDLPNCTVCDGDCCITCSDGYALDIDDCSCIANTTVTSTSTVTTSIRPLPPSTNDENNNNKNWAGVLTGIIFAIVLGMLILLATIALATYLVYYLLQRYVTSKTQYATARSQGPGLQFHENPLYLRPEEVTGDTTRLL